MIQQLQNLFLAPQNLMALASIIALLLLYLLKPKPEKKMMPSVMFFREEESPGKLKQGIRKLLNNRFLLLHLLIISTIAVSMADPYTLQPERTGEVTIVLDATANTADSFENYRDYAETHLSESNNLVVVDNQVNSYNDIGRSRAQQIIQETSSTEVKGDLSLALSAARSLEGNTFIASNMAGTKEMEAQNQLNTLSKSKYIDIKKDSFQNSWGITDYEVVNNSARIYIKNYMSQETEPRISVNSEEKEIEVDDSELKPVEVQLRQGRNNITLQEDEYSVDNSLYLYRPALEDIKVNIKGELPFMKEVVRTIPKAREVNEESDILAVSASQEDVERSEIEQGLNMVYFSDSEVNIPDYMPVSGQQLQEGDVRVNTPVQTSVYSTEYISGSLSGAADNYTDPAAAIVKEEIGEGSLVQYNMVQDDFERQLVFPIFWRKVFKEMEELRTISESNIEPGSNTVESETLNQGYTETADGIYGVSTTGVFPKKELDIGSRDRLNEKRKSFSGQLNSLVLLLLLIETLMIYREKMI